jgi:hypothetical protein
MSIATWVINKYEYGIKAKPEDMLPWAKKRVWSDKGQPTSFREEKEPCPSCGLDTYFSRRFLGSWNDEDRPNPAPQCYACGFPLVQQGSESGELADVEPDGTVTPALQAQSPIPFGTFWEGKVAK